MPTAVVVATIVNTNMSEAGFRQHVVDQLRVNERSLRDRLADADDDANVVTAVLNVDEFLSYLIRRFPKAVDAAISIDKKINPVATPEPVESRPDAQLNGGPVSNVDAKNIDIKKMSEGEFMNFVMQGLESGEIEPAVRFAADDSHEGEDWAGGDWDGEIGEDISRYPFFY